MRSCRPLRAVSLAARARAPRLASVNRRFASSSSQNPQIYDVVCVGGGSAGLSLVNGLRANRATSHLKVALVETQDLSKTIEAQDKATHDAYSNRCSSLTPATVRYFDEIGAWRHVETSRVRPFDEMKVWDGVSGARIQFDWASAGLPPAPPPSYDAGAVGGNSIAYMTENGNITSALLRRAEELGGVAFHDKTKVEDISFGVDDGELDLTSWPVLRLSDGSHVAARLLVGADGANSPVRSFAGIPSRGWDYERHGVVATLRLEDGYTDLATAYQRFLPTGPAALLPLPNGFASLVWSTLPAHAAMLKKLAAADMASMVNAAFRLSPVDMDYLHSMPSGGQADEYAWRAQHTRFDAALVPPAVTDVQPGTVASFPLRMRHADTYIGERVALIGDAAHTIHPLAGQGLNQGQADSQALLAVVAAAAETGQDVGSTLALEPYNAQRYAANHILLGVVDKLHKLYSVGSGPLVPLRSWGLEAVDAVGALKGVLMRVASGSGGRGV